MSFALVVQAQSPSTQNLESFSSFGPSNTKISADVTYEFDKYTSDLLENPNLNQSQLMKLDMQVLYQAYPWEYKVDFLAGHYVDWKSSNFAVRELSAEFTSQHVETSLGRRLESWSSVDHNWNLGLWQPIFNEDALRPVEQGLTGFFARVQPLDSEVTIFVTPIFIPTMGPSVKEKDNDLVADSRWYRAPSSTASLLGKDIKVTYSLDDVDVAKLISNPGAAVRWKFGEENYWVAASIGRKPINSLTLRYKRDLTLSQLSGDATVAPAITYHRISSLDAGWSLQKDFEISASLLNDDPEFTLPPGDPTSPRVDWVQQQPGPLRVFGLRLEKNWERIWYATVDYLRVSETPTLDYDSKGIVRGSLFPYRSNFTNALRLASKWRRNLSWTREVTTSLSWTRDFDQQGDIVQAELAVQSMASWGVLMGMDLLAADDSSDTNTDSRFINQFRANDRIYGGVTYAF